MTTATIKSMNLYSRADRVFNDLKAAGIGPGDPLDVDVLSRFDQYHYFGTDAVDEAIVAAGITQGSRVLDIGAGIGGPARYLAAKTGCTVTAIELQRELNDVARELTGRCGLSDKIEHRCGDVLAQDLTGGGYDAVVSWLCFYHIPDRAGLLRQCMTALRPGGTLYVEDLFSIGAFSAAEAPLVSNMLFGNYLPSRETYETELASAGLRDISFNDMTAAWTPFVNARRDAYLENRATNLAVHGAEITDGMEAFYDAVAALFNGGNLGGARVVARKP